MSLEEDDDDSIDFHLTDFVRNAFFQKEVIDKSCNVLINASNTWRPLKK